MNLSNSLVFIIQIDGVLPIKKIVIGVDISEQQRTLFAFFSSNAKQTLLGFDELGVEGFWCLGPLQ